MDTLMAGHEYTIEFRIFGEGLDPDAVTRELGLRPCQVRVAGAGPRPELRDSMWAYNGTDDEKPIEWDSLAKGLSHVLQRLLPHKAAIEKHARGGHALWWCGHFQNSFDGGPTLPSQLLKELGDFGFDLFIDNYQQRQP